MNDYVFVNGEPMSCDELYHYGVKGMKWGVRRNNAAYYNKRAKKLEDRARVNRTMSSMNRTAANRSTGLISKANTINANYYQNRADKLTEKANKNKAMATKKANEKKVREELRDAGYKNSFGYHATNHTKQAIARGVGALGVAVVGSAATHALAKKGQQYAAERVYKMSRNTFDTLVFTAKVSAGMAAVNAMMGGPKAISDYRKTEKEIRSKYR